MKMNIYFSYLYVEWILDRGMDYYIYCLSPLMT